MVKKKITNPYTTDGKVVTYSSEGDINTMLGKILGDKFLNYRKIWDKANNMEIVTDFPLFLHLDMNQECNYKCPHCIIGTLSEVKENYSGDYLDFNNFKKVIDEGSEHNCPSMEPQGNNEPFLIKDLHKYIYYAHQKGFIDIMLNNNGSALTKKRAQQILDSGLTRLRFSLDAFTPETYSKVRVGSIPLKRVLKNIFTFLELKEKGNYKLPVVGVSFCEMKHNEHELYDKYYSTKQLNEAPIKDFKCVQPFQRVMIKNDKITPCCVSFNKDLILGSIHDTTILDAWNSEKMKQIREMHREGKFYLDKTCNDCVNIIYPNHKINIPTQKI